MALREGSAKCSNICPYYADSGVVRGCYGVPLATHCRATMEPVIVDCDVYDPRKIQTMDVTEDEWEAMQAAVHKRAQKIQKEYPDEHEEIHPIGWNWKSRSTNSATGLRDAQLSAPLPPLSPCESDAFCGDPKGKWNAEKSKSARIVADRRTMDHRKKVKKSTITNN